jgi:hypothetical protein
MNEITKKWGDYGLLYGITDEYERNILAFKYEEVSILTLQDNQPLIRTQQDRLETVIFPIIRRVYGEYKNVNTQHLYEHFKNWIMDNHERIEEDIKKAMNGYFRVDVEAEETANYCNTYIEEFKNNITPMKYLSKHNL